MENKKEKKKQGESTKAKHSLIYMPIWRKKTSKGEAEHIMRHMNWQMLCLHLFFLNNDDTTKNS